MHESEVRITGLLQIAGTPVEIDLGNYKHTRLTLLSSADGVYLSNTSQVSTNNGFMIQSGTAEVPLPSLNLDGLSGIVWAVRDGSGLAILSIIQWGAL